MKPGLRIDRIIPATLALNVHRDPTYAPSCNGNHPRAPAQIGAHVIEHIARIRIQLPTSCPEGALFHTIALGLMPAGS